MYRYLQTGKCASVYNNIIMYIIPLCPGFKCTDNKFRNATSARVRMFEINFNPSIHRYPFMVVFNIKRIYFYCCFRTRPTHPGPIVHLSDNPADSSKVNPRVLYTDILIYTHIIITH